MNHEKNKFTLELDKFSEYLNLCDQTRNEIMDIWGAFGQYSINAVVVG